MHLVKVSLPHKMLHCNDVNSSSSIHLDMITKMLGGTHNDLQIASEELYTKFKQSFKQLPDWNEYSVHLEQLTDARESYFIL